MQRGLISRGLISGSCLEVSPHKAVSQSCAVAKSEVFWRATGQSNLADRMEDYSTGRSAVV